MKSSPGIFAAIILTLAAGGWGVKLLGPEYPKRGQSRGWRAMAADWTWLEANLAWERRDAARTEALLRLTVALDPGPLYFWINGARIMAYDIPAWRIDAGASTVPPRERVRSEAAKRAIDFIEEAQKRHPASAALWVERGNIELNGRHDLTAAAECYRTASEQPGAPYFAARLHAELLRRAGRKREALAWLKAVYPTLPPGDEAAAAGVVLARIRALERELDVPPSRSFAPAHPAPRRAP